MSEGKRSMGNRTWLMPLSPQRLKVFLFVASCSTFPSRQKIAEHMGWRTVAGVNDVLNVLDNVGLVIREGRSHWSMTDLGRAEATRLSSAEAESR